MSGLTDVWRIRLSILPASIVTPAAAAAQAAAKEEQEHEHVRRCNGADELGVGVIEHRQTGLSATRQRPQPT